MKFIKRVKDTLSNYPFTITHLLSYNYQNLFTSTFSYDT